MKLGIIAAVDWEKGLPIGGLSRVILSLLPYLQGEIYLLGAHIKGADSKRREMVFTKCHFIPLFTMSLPSRLPLRIKALLGYWRNKNRIARLKLDLLYIHSPEAALPFLIGSRIAPVVFHQHGSFSPVENTDYFWARNDLVRFLFDNIYRLLFKRSNAIIAIDKPCFSLASSYGAAKKTVLITNPVDTSMFDIDLSSRDLERVKYHISEDQRVLVFAGRLSRKKNIEVIIESLAIARRRGRNWNLIIAGTGPLLNILEKKVQELVISDYVKFLGAVQYSDMPALYNTADAVVLPSVDEGIPMMLLEALSCGTPVVATDVGGIPEFVIHEENGILIDRPKKDLLFQGLELCFNKIWERNIVRKSIVCFSARETSNRLDDIFEKSLTNWHSARE